MTIQTREDTGFERLTWTVAPHARGTRPARNFPTADGSGGLKTFQLRFPVRGTYTYDHDDCQETYSLGTESMATVSARQIGSTKVRFVFGLDPRRRSGTRAPECRPRMNNALRFFLANQPSTTVTVAANGLSQTTFTVNARGRQTNPGTTLTWELSLDVARLGQR